METRRMEMSKRDMLFYLEQLEKETKQLLDEESAKVGRINAEIVVYKIMYDTEKLDLAREEYEVANARYFEVSDKYFAIKKAIEKYNNIK